jgi:hypothetical protein
MPVDLLDPLPTRLNVGCGWDHRPGFLNVDLMPKHNPDLVADVTDMPMLPSGHFEEIVAQDVLEHFERSKTMIALREWGRLLSPTGILYVRVPSLLHMMDLLESAEGRGPEEAAKIIHLIYGTQAYNGDYHLAGFTYSTLCDQLTSAGLTIKRLEMQDTWLFDLQITKDVSAHAAPDVRSRATEIDALKAEIDRLRAEVAMLRGSAS